MKTLFQKIDKPLFFLSLIYTILGLVMVLSASSVSAVLRYNVSSSYFFVRQLLFMGAAWFVGLFFILKIPTKKYRFLAPIYLFGTISLLFLVFGYGAIAGGAQSWLDLGFFNLQPTEFVKTALILYMAVFYEKSIKKRKPFAYNFIPIIFAVIAFFLVAMQPDFGGAVIIAGIVFFTFLTVPFEKESSVQIIKFVGVAGLLAAAILLYSGSDIFNSTQLARLKFQNPCERYMEDTGYQVCNGFIAYHNGGLFGVGLGNSSQKYLYLPEAHTDFIFPILVEELGLIVGILIILGYVYMLYRILKIAKNADSIRNAIVCYGTFIYLLMHLLINLMGTLALIPLTGVPLPFLSYGGSFNMNVVAMLFVVQRIAVENKQNAEKRALANMTR
ncbi:TPA: FtsW/RodA/SpoVE family cell cycle protein [Candidatus Ventrenecus stercoripullorum]|nr:FtsW/RodA/SpoVE family cell cycle protein [Candidatus Ventrenecus stercoripullorum]